MRKGLNISLIYDDKIPFQYLKTEVTVQNSTLSEIANLFFADELLLCESEGVGLNKDVCNCFVLLEAYVLSRAYTYLYINSLYVNLYLNLYI